MSQKKESTPQLTAVEQDQLQQTLALYHHIAAQLHHSADRAQAETTLAGITALPVTVQLALLKALSQEASTDAADVLLAVNTLSQQKEVRKEARRSLLRLESNKTFPLWTPPVIQAPAVQMNIAHPPRFWKGLVTQMREEGELQVTLAWEQGYDYSETRVIGFVLDYWFEGVKDATADTMSKRRYEERIRAVQQSADAPSLTDCTLAEGRQLLEEALSVNEWRGIPPAEGYRTYLPVINRLILQAEVGDELHGRTFITPDLENQEVVVNFIGAWSFGDYGLAYDLLTSDCNLRAGLERSAWVAAHRAWYDEAHPARMELGFVHERPVATQQNTLWLPSSVSARKPERVELEVGWSLELDETPLSGTLKDLPMGSAVNKDTGRHWFWTNYILVREQGSWRIQHATDEALALQGLSANSLQARIKEYEDAIEKSAQQREAAQEVFAEEVAWRLAQLLHFYDALLVQLPLDQPLYEEAYGCSVITGNPERMLVYLDKLQQRFPPSADTLRRLGSTLAGLAYEYREQEAMPEHVDRPERAAHLLDRAQSALRQAIEIDGRSLNHSLLGELFLSMKLYDDAETELRQAAALDHSPEEEATIEAALGHVAMRREHFAESIPHYKRVAELNPQYPGIWFNLGFAERLLGRFAEAEPYYQLAIQSEPADIRPFSELTAIYMNQTEHAKARDLMQQAVRINPASAHLHALYASVLFEMNDQRNALLSLAEAERLDPDLEIVQNVRKHVQTVKK